MKPHRLLIVPAAILVIAAGTGLALQAVIAKQDREAERAVATVVSVPDRFGYQISYSTADGKRCERYLKSARYPRLAVGSQLTVLHRAGDPCGDAWDPSSGISPFALAMGIGAVFALVLTFLGWRVWRSPPTPRPRHG